MNLKEDIKPITYLKTSSAQLVANINRNKRPVIITQNGEARVVVQDIQSFERDRKALVLLKILAQGVSEANHKQFVEQDVLFDRLKRKLVQKS